MAATAPLAGVQRIEASAGTGKTWTLSGLLLRFVIEHGVPVDRILAVTYTRAATAELRERVRRRLQDMLDLLEGREVDDELCRLLARRCADRDLARRRTLAALRSFDEAPISTIHGFCQRALADRAFACGLPFDFEVVAEAQDARLQVAEDFWRREVSERADGDLPGPELHALFAGWLMQREESPAKLSRWLKPLLDKGELHIEPPPQPPPGRAPGSPLAIFQRAVTLWSGERERIVALLTRHPSLNQNKYRPASIVNWARELDAFLVPAGDSLTVPEPLHKFTREGVEAARKGSGEVPHHVFFELARQLAEASKDVVAYFEWRWLALRLRLLARAPSEIRTRLRDERLQSYRDMLVDLREALRDPASGPALVGALRRRYPVALIDEFQDTDPVQYDIFRCLYLEAPPDSGVTLFMVGDPKQAIYAFRGADVFAYLRASRAAPSMHALAQNQRSIEALVQAVNALFGAGPNPFVFPDIGFTPATASGRPQPALVDPEGTDVAPLRWFLAAPDGADAWGKGQARKWAAAACAGEIERLLAQSRAGSLRLGARPLGAGDIAVLVDSGAHGVLVRAALAVHGIASAMRLRDSVFRSPEAEQLERVLRAAAEPRRDSLLRAALATELLGLTAPELARLDQDRPAWDRWAGVFEQCHETWRARGFMPMIRRLLAAEGVAGRLSAFQDGARRLTNLFHLAELLHVESGRLPGVAAQLAWFAGQRQEPAGAEDQELRLESDENLVQIMTVHASKGLEYPVTFVPFLWDGISRVDGEEPLYYHDRAADDRATLDARRPADPAALALAQREERAERLRLAYVALTRARNRCYVCWGRISEAGASPLGWLLHGDGERLDPTLPDDAGLRQRIDDLGRLAAGAMRIIDDAPAGDGDRPDTAATDLVPARVLRTPVPAPFRLASFSSLKRRVDARAEQPDHDDEVDPAVAASHPRRPPPDGSRFGFPAGADAGDCLHAMLESIDFSRPVAQSSAAILRALGAHQLPPDWLPAVCDWLGEVCATPLPDGRGAGTFRLADLAPADTLRELPFHLPLAGVEVARIADIARRHGYALAPMQAQSLTGFLNGFIDLVARHDGRYYIADYKSHWLGVEAPDYGMAPLDAVMDRDHYRLQLLLYTVAVNRWLATRIAGYGYDTHFGAVHYLFLRGMHPQWQAEAGTSAGVLVDRPPRALVEELDLLLGAAPRALG